MPDSLIPLAVAVPVILLLVSLYWMDRVRRRKALLRWASDHGYRVLAFRQPLLTEASPFPFSFSKSQHVFQVDVQDALGKRRSGWVRLGSAWRGLTSRKADVQWTPA
jgi:hypothetical protein